jgi:hypothetical protein
LSHFAIDSCIEIAYTLAAPQGVNGKKVFENKKSAVSILGKPGQVRQSAKSTAK